MTSLAVACAWAILATIIAILASRRSHWPQAYGLIAIGLPILAWVFWQNGLLIALIVLTAGASVLRWPVRYGVRWLRRVTGLTPPASE